MLIVDIMKKGLKVNAGWLIAVLLNQSKQLIIRVML